MCVYIYIHTHTYIYTYVRNVRTRIRTYIQIRTHIRAQAATPSRGNAGASWRFPPRLPMARLWRSAQLRASGPWSIINAIRVLYVFCVFVPVATFAMAAKIPMQSTSLQLPGRGVLCGVIRCFLYVSFYFLICVVCFVLSHVSVHGFCL